MNLEIAARVLAALMIQATAAGAGMPFFLDPVITYNNGMPLATSEPVRDADTQRGCSRDHLGCCGGEYRSPLRESLYRPNRCCYHGQLILDDRTPSSVLIADRPAAPLGNGLEPGRVVRLGPAPNVSANPTSAGPSLLPNR